jgi:hypothetical protein
VSLLVASKRRVAALPGSQSAREDLAEWMKSAFPKIKKLRERGLSLRAVAAERVSQMGSV